MTALVIVAALSALAIVGLCLLLRQSLNGSQEALEAAVNERCQDRENMARERAQWAEERSILLTRIQDPPAGMAQAFALMAPPASPTQADESPERW